MRVAVASEDGESISAHFGRCACFIVFDAEEGAILRKELRENTHASQDGGNCHVPGHGGQPHSHADLIKTLHDCQAALCYGMGWRAAGELKQNGIQPVVVGRKCTPEEAVAMLVAGKLALGDREFCAGRHHHDDQ